MPDPRWRPPLCFTFTPDDSSDTIAAPDADHLYFGYWLHKPDTPGYAHMFSTFAGGSDMFDLRGDDPQSTDDASRLAIPKFLSFTSLLAKHATKVRPRAST